jgi:hypothetical protein
MIFFVISIAWLTIATLVVVLCRAAARGEQALEAPPIAPVSSGRVVVHQRTRWQGASVAGEVRLATATSSPRSRPPARGSRCATGS